MSELMRRTKADLVGEVERLTAQLAAIPRAEKRNLDKEASAIDKCVYALEPLRSGNTHTYSYTSAQERPSVDRVLRYLATRFGVSLIEVRECSRPHADYEDFTPPPFGAQS